ncbi:MAG: hypothetical protein K6T73_02810 [Candidatus Bathyarchaeota archaeon]|jgi:hypothetical protein|nr:hypothetical protein [Candidatus Bathyarchaeota archaeon]
MDILERRVIGALLLLLGVSALAVAIHTNQLTTTVEMLKNAFKTVII